MIRLIVLVALVLAATYLVEAVSKRARRSLSEPGEGGRRRIRQAGPWSRGAGQQDRGGELVACDACGVFTPTSRALWRGKDGPYCSEECRRRAVTAS